MNEITLNKIVCPHGHDVRLLPSGGYHCATCIKDYARDELKEVPLANPPRQRNSVYGHIN